MSQIAGYNTLHSLIEMQDEGLQFYLFVQESSKLYPDLSKLRILATACADIMTYMQHKGQLVHK